MKGIQYKQANTVLLGGRPDVYDLPIFRFQYSDGQEAIESCWQMSFRERLRALFTGKIYFQCWGRTHPPILLSVKAALEEGKGMKLRDKHGWPVERIKGRPIINFLRLLILTDVKQTLKRRKA
jgi:hypothetical protein